MYKFCIRNNISVERNIPIEYWYNNKKHITFIDFKIDDYLVEVKGTHLLEGVYSDRIVPITEKFKVYRENHVIIITKTDHPDEIFSNFNNLNQLIGIDIDLFRGSDYLNIDENLKWDLIKYQIEQFVNYIDSKSLQILLKNNLKFLKVRKSMKLHLKIVHEKNNQLFAHIQKLKKNDLMLHYYVYKH